MAETDAEAAAAVTEDQVDLVIREMVRVLAPVPRDDVAGPHRLINDLGYHSLALAELGFSLEDLFGLDAVTPEQAMALSTVDDLSGLIDSALAASTATLPPTREVALFFERHGATWNPGG